MPTSRAVDSGDGVPERVTRKQFEKVVGRLDQTIAQEAVRQAREDSLPYEEFCQML
jgi:hypothetical protein